MYKSILWIALGGVVIFTIGTPASAAPISPVAQLALETKEDGATLVKFGRREHRGGIRFRHFGNRHRGFRDFGFGNRHRGFRDSGFGNRQRGFRDFGFGNRHCGFRDFGFGNRHCGFRHFR